MAGLFDEILFERVFQKHNRILDALATLVALFRLDTNLEVPSFDIYI